MRQSIAVILSAVTLISLGSSTLKLIAATPESNSVTLAQQPNCKEPVTQADMNICAGLDYQQADKKLNQIYKRLLPKLEGSRRQKLITAQQAWINFRDKSCAFERSEVEGGTMAPMIYAGCLTELTKQRTNQLEAYLRD